MSRAKEKQVKVLRQDVASDLFAPLGLVLTLIALVGSMQAVASSVPGHGSAAAFFRIFLSKGIYCWYFLVPALAVRTISRRLLLTKSSAVRWFLVHFAALSCSFLIHEMLSLNVDRYLLGAEIRTDLIFTLFNNPSVWMEIFAYSLFLLGFSLIEYRRVLQENEERCTLLEAQLLQSRLQELRSKIQPVFLFRTLQTILDLVRAKRYRDANNILSLLSDFLRTTVYETNRDEITLGEEIRLLNQFLDIEKIRSGQSFHVAEEIEHADLQAVVPEFLLQPIVEELVYRISGAGYERCDIVIRAARSADLLEIAIEEHHDVRGDASAGGSQREAIFDVTQERLAHLYGNRQQFGVQVLSDGGMMVTLRLPFREAAAESEGTFVAEDPG